jgi:hypothetical protein
MTAPLLLSCGNSELVTDADSNDAELGSHSYGDCPAAKTTELRRTSKIDILRRTSKIDILVVDHGEPIAIDLDINTAADSPA